MYVDISLIENNISFMIRSTYMYHRCNLIINSEIVIRWQLLLTIFLLKLILNELTTLDFSNYKATVIWLLIEVYSFDMLLQISLISLAVLLGFDTSYYKWKVWLGLIEIKWLIYEYGWLDLLSQEGKFLQLLREIIAELRGSS